MSELQVQPDRPNGKTNRITKQTILSTIKYSFFLFLAGLVLSVSVGFGYVASLVKEQPLLSFQEFNEKIFSQPQTSYAYFNGEQLIGHLRTEEHRRIVKIDDISPNLIKAVVATEDRFFYEHYGVNFYGLFRAGYEQLTGSSVQTGGSSITQQLVKQTILTPEVNFERKFREIFLAMRLERMFSKDQILEAYLNKMYFGKNANGSNIYGAQAASSGIFGVDVKDLNIPQASYIAGMLQAPSRYMPFNPDGLAAGKNRQRIVLDRMLEVEFITEQEYNDALAYDIAAHLREPDEVRAYNRYPHLMMAIEAQAAKVLADQEIEQNPEMYAADMSPVEYEELLDFKLKELMTKGYHVYTTIDQQIYDMMRAIADNPRNFAPPRSYTTSTGKRVENAIEQVGATLLDNKTGAVLGFIGGRDFKNSQYNHTAISRQPGSVMKPVAAYAPALELGLLQPGSIIDDSPLALDNGPGNPPFYPSNYDNRFRGLMTTREALRDSRNIPAIKAYLEVGPEKALDFVQQMGITTILTPEKSPRRNDFQSQTLPIGGMTEGVTVEELTNAFTVFANQGVWQDSFMISKITDASHQTIFEHQATPRRVYSEQTAYLMTDMLKTVIQSGTATSIKSYIGSREAAGKTGTTNNDFDSWFVGYTPEVSLGVWIGYDERHSLPRARPARSIQIWGKIMQNLYQVYPDQYPRNSRFSKPDGIVYREICSHSGLLASDVCRQEGKVITEMFDAKYAPTQVDQSLPEVVEEEFDEEDEEIIEEENDQSDGERPDVDREEKNEEQEQEQEQDHEDEREQDNMLSEPIEN